MVDVTAGRDGRLAPAPKGDIYRRDPEAARAQAIRERVALFQRQGKPVPDHLQHLYDSLPSHEKLDVDLVDEKTGDQISEVDVVGPGRSAAPREDLAPPPGPFSRSQRPPRAPEPLEVEAVELPEPVAPVEPVEPVAPVVAVVAPTLDTGTHSGAGTLGAQAQAVARAATNSPPSPPPPRKQSGRPRKVSPPR